MAGIYHLEYGEELVLLAELEYVKLGALPHSCNVLIREAHLLCRGEGLKLEGMSLESFLHIDDVLDRLEEEGSDLGNFVYFLDSDAACEKLCDCKDVVVAEGGDIFKDLLVRHIIELRVVNVVNANLERAHTLEEALFKVRADAHNLAGRLHLSSELI